MILDALRARTAAAHARAERAMNITARLARVEDYAALLGRLFGYYQPVEAALARAGDFHPAGLDLRARRKCELLAADLSALGHSSPDELPRCAWVPAPTSAEEVLGTLYVLEGATLGGKVVRRLVADRLGLTATTGCAFFTGYGDRVGVMWQEFCAVLRRDADSLPPPAGERLLTAAADTFDTLTGWLEADAGPCPAGVSSDVHPVG